MKIIKIFIKIIQKKEKNIVKITNQEKEREEKKDKKMIQFIKLLIMYEAECINI